MSLGLDNELLGGLLLQGNDIIKVKGLVQQSLRYGVGGLVNINDLEYTIESTPTKHRKQVPIGDDYSGGKGYSVLVPSVYEGGGDKQGDGGIHQE